MGAKWISCVPCLRPEASDDGCIGCRREKWLYSAIYHRMFPEKAEKQMEAARKGVAAYIERTRESLAAIFAKEDRKEAADGEV